MKNDNLLTPSEPLLVIIGPSAVGKSTIVNRLIQASLVELTPDWTERPARPGEQAGEHIFATPAEMDQQAAAGYFVHPPMPFLGLTYRYALPKIKRASAGKVPLVLTRAAALPLLDRYYPNHKIYQIEAPLERVKTFIAERSAGGEQQGNRLEGYQTELEAGRTAADRVFMNDDINATVSAIAQAIRQEFKNLTVI